ncbi:hypothetical protein HGA92_02925 [Candidatus Gracilibacteria bacterium]|nr:hypothetical protein [Candidatus Gracilibacteria bacterium]NUJ98370.1 hypothetical protein [Candidatus Gracilibacteria bacterium]
MDEGKTQTKISISSLKADFDKDKISTSPSSLKDEKSKIEEKKINIIEEEKTKEDISLSGEEINGTGEILKEENSDELFTNYTPIFEKRRISFLERLEALKKKAKTNYKFILIIIFVGGIITGSIIYLDPQHQSFPNYKANVLNIVSKIKGDKNINTSSIENKEQINISGLSLSGTIKADEENNSILTTEKEQIKIEREKVGREKIKEYFKNH